jgi:hypothetical protein
VVGTIEGAVVFLGAWFDDSWGLGFAVPMSGFVLFLSVLILGYWWGEKRGNEQRWAIRDALASGFFAAYFTLLGLSLGVQTQQSDIVKTLVSNFTYLMGVIIVFYFGSKAVTEYIQMKAPPDAGEGGPAGPTGPS